MNKIQALLKQTAAIDATLLIRPSDEFFIGYFWCNKFPATRKFVIPLTPQDVSDLNENLQNCMQELCNFEKYDLNDSDLDEKLYDLAIKGASAFRKIFSDAPLRKLIGGGAVFTNIQITSDGFFIPWEFLYDGDVSNDISLELFWGFRYLVSRNIINNDFDITSYLSAARSPSKIQVGLVANKNLDHVVDKEIPFLKQLHQDEKILLSILDELETSNKRSDLKKILDFLNSGRELIHFACHAEVGHHKGSNSFVVTDDFYITHDDLVANDVKISSNSFVILNACRTGTIDPLYTSNWARMLLLWGGKGVLATEFYVPDKFAAEFVEILYHGLLSGMSIGESLLSTRKSVLMRSNSPLGLAYALYSDPGVTI